MYAILPETEDRTLEDIELHFSDNNRKLTDRKIGKFDSITKVEHVKSDATTKQIPTISTIIETDWQQKLDAAKGGCDNGGFTMESTKCWMFCSSSIHLHRETFILEFIFDLSVYII